MKLKVNRNFCFILPCLVTAVLLASLPAWGVGGTCSSCYPGYQNCMEGANDDGFVSITEQDLCGSLLAGCFNHCQQTQYQYCTYEYDYYFAEGCEGPVCCTPTGWYNDQSWQIDLQASHCSNYHSMGSTLSCQSWP